MANHPKKLTREAALMLKHLITLMGEEQSIKIKNNDSFMAVIVEHHTIIPTSPFGMNISVYSVAHYYEQEGDLMADPLMEFIYASENEGFYPSIYPCYFQMDGIFARYERSINTEDKFTFQPRVQADQTSFANQWFRNIKHQQFPELKFPLSPQEKAIQNERKSYRNELKSLLGQFDPKGKLRIAHRR